MAISQPTDAESDNSLLARIRAGDERAFEALVLEHYNELCVFATRMTGRKMTAEEIVQDVFLRLWQRRDQLTLSGSIVAYLHAAVRNQALNELARERRWWRWRTRKAEEQRSLTTERPTSLDADDRVRSHDLEQAIERAIAALPPRCREAYTLRRLRGLSHAEIAEIMRTTPKTVEVQIGKALRLLRKHLADWL